MLNFIFTCVFIYMGWRFYKRIVQDFAPRRATIVSAGHRKSGEYLLRLLQDIELVAHSDDNTAEFRLAQIAELADKRRRVLTDGLLPRLKDDGEFDES